MDQVNFIDSQLPAYVVVVEFSRPLAEELRDLLAETYARMHGKPKGASVAEPADN